ncbi:MAG TPA: serine/threonine-protein kinase, partial [Kofleriaceae bacterium]|nr:serine/threonine-protein kinase [Kofleriaceae bacterium]
KKTQLGTAPGRTVRPTGSQTPVAAAGTPVPATIDAAKAKTSYLPDVPDPLLGATVAGRYKIIRKLGEGGMGSVYLAMHTILEKQVALKVLHGEFARKPDLVDRFMQEAKAASRIRHENVIDISDFGVTPDGHVFFAMELLQGHDLHDSIARAKLAGQLLPWSRTKKIFLQICGALAAAHARGIVHRDLKPENVYLIDFLGDPDFVKLLDFGIAKLTDVSNEEGGRKLTKTGMLFGTPEYMSPEQARGENVDHRVDVYAMGCILFQLVTNRVPFEADNFMGVLSQHLTEQPPSIPPQVFDQIGAPRALADVIDKALEKNRDARWQTIEEFAAAVRQVSGDPPAADKSQPMRAANVASPSETTRARPPTGPVVGRQRSETGRVKTQWTGNLHVPEAAEPTAKPKSKAPLIIGLGVLVVGGAVAAVVALKGGGGGAGEGSAVASGSAPAVAPVVQPPVQPPPPPPPPPPKDVLPEQSEIVLTSDPKGAVVTDLSNNRVLGTTPQRFKIAGSTTPRQFKFTLKGYGDSTVELVPNRALIEYAETLHKGATKPNAVTKVPEQKPADKPGDAVTKPDTPEIKPVDIKPADTKPADTKPADTQKPPDKPKDDCPEDEQPCLKTHIPGMGSDK